MYIQVDVTYPVPIFVPFVGSFFDNGSGAHTATITQVIRIEPCTMVKGGT
jgi:hypothetical protein